MATLFDRLQYNFTDTYGDITTLPDAATAQINSMPTILTTWARDDIINNTASGYFINPCANSSNIILSTTNTLVNIVSTMTGTFSSNPTINNKFITIATTLKNIVGHDTDGNTVNWRASNKPDTLGKFLRHTNRLSGVDTIITTEIEQTANLPHYETASGIGKAVMFITHQSDGISNNSPMLGSFTSILIANTVRDYANTLNTYYTTIISSNARDIPQNSNTSNLTLATLNTISDFANTMNTSFNERRLHDENFYTNSLTLLTEVSNMSKFSNYGSSEKGLIDGFIGSDKLKIRLAS
jgi:hypothetical protein